MSIAVTNVGDGKVDVRVEADPGANWREASWSVDKLFSELAGTAPTQPHPYSYLKRNDAELAAADRAGAPRAFH